VQPSGFCRSYSSDYKERLTVLYMLPLMMTYEIHDISFFLKSLTSKSPHAFDILDYAVDFNSFPTRPHKLRTRYSRTNKSRHFYFSRLPRLWNALPTADLINKSLNNAVYIIKSLFMDYFSTELLQLFTSMQAYHFQCPCHLTHSHLQLPELYFYPVILFIYVFIHGGQTPFWSSISTAFP